MTDVKRYTFFYHYHRHGERKMTVHFRKKCYQVDDIVCNTKCETKWNKGQPRLVMKGKTKGVIIMNHRNKVIASIL